MTVKKSNEKFIQESLAVHGNKYNYDQVQYTSTNNKIKILCIKHNCYFDQIAKSHLGGQIGCKLCYSEYKSISFTDFLNRCGELFSNENYDYSLIDKEKFQIKKIVEIICIKHNNKFSQIASHHSVGILACKQCYSESIRLSSKDFFDKCNKVYDNLYQYDLNSYTLYSNNIKGYCINHNENFEVLAGEHVRGNARCPQCTRDAIFEGNKSKRLRSFKEFVKVGNEIYQGKYTYEKSEVGYGGVRDNITITCKKHGDFITFPETHLSLTKRSGGCNSCKIDNMNYFDRWVEKAKETHNNKYTYENSIYTRHDSPIMITCPNHGSINTTPTLHLITSGCYKCSNGHSSPIEREWLNSLNIPDDKESRQVKIIIGDKKFFVDGFDPITNTVYEFNGDYWHGNPDVYDANKINNSTNCTFGELHIKTKNKENLLKNSGYNVISIWENDWAK